MSGIHYKAPRLQPWAVIALKLYPSIPRQYKSKFQHTVNSIRIDEKPEGRQYLEKISISQALVLFIDSLC